MPYQLMLRTPGLLHVAMFGPLQLEVAEAFFQDAWQLLDGCPNPTDILVDGRGLQTMNDTARRRAEQVVYHPHIGHIAFVVRPEHISMIAPVIQAESGIGLFGSEREALRFLNDSRTLLSIGDSHELDQPKRQAHLPFISPTRTPSQPGQLPKPFAPYLITQSAAATPRVDMDHRAGMIDDVAQRADSTCTPPNDTKWS